MKDPVAMAYVNMFAVLGSLDALTRLAPEARAALTNKSPVTILMTVRGGPTARFVFADGQAKVEAGDGACDIRIPFSGCEKFNAMIDGTATPIPTKGFTKLRFLTKNFTALTDVLSSYLRPNPERLKDEAFFRASTELTLYVVAAAVAQLGNHDQIGRFSASNIVDGAIELGIKNGPGATIAAKDHVLTSEKKRPDRARAVMEFGSIELARALFDGKVNAVACIGDGSIEMRGMISMLDNLNRLLDRASAYLS